MQSDYSVRQRIINQLSPGRYKICATAGAGKTTLCCTFIEKNLETDSTIVYISHTNNAVEEAKTRLPQNKGLFVLTFSKFCLDLLKMGHFNVPKNPTEVVTRAKKVNLCILDRCSSIEMQYQVVLETLKTLLLLPHTNKSVLHSFFRTPFSSKHSTTFDFHTVFLYYLLHQKTMTVSANVFIIDEVQDIDLFNISLIEEMSFQRVLFVGDPRQSIYLQSGVNFFLHEVSKKYTELNICNTFRFSQNVCNLIYRDQVLSKATHETQIMFGQYQQPHVHLVVTNKQVVDTVLSLKHENVTLTLTQRRLEILQSKYNQWLQFNEKLKKFLQKKHPSNRSNKSNKSNNIWNTDLREEYAFFIQTRYQKNIYEYTSLIWQHVPHLSNICKIVSSYSGEEGVCVDTVYAFKGKTANVVYVSPYCHFSMIRHVDNDYLKHCLYYVALTRAKTVLVLPKEWEKSFDRPF